MYLRIFCRRFTLIAFIAAAFLLTGCGEKTVATAGNEFEANQMFDILHSNGFSVERKVAEGDVKAWNVIVDEGWFGENEAATAIQVLRDYGLPRPPEPESKSSDSLGIVSDREEREKQKRELQQQVERQLYTFSDVIRASVIIAQPVSDVFSLEKTPPTAAVSLVLKENQAKFSIEDVQSQVSGGVPNLKPENVKVTITQQALREIPLEKLADQRRSNKIRTVGAGIIILLGLSLGVVLTLSKRRRQRTAFETGELSEGDDTDIFEMPERPMLNAEEEEK